MKDDAKEVFETFKDRLDLSSSCFGAVATKIKRMSLR